jgi:hypothetical protein
MMGVPQMRYHPMSTEPTPANLPERAEKLASQVRFGLQAIRFAAIEMEDKANQVYAFALDITNANLIPHGYDVEDIPGHPGLQVVYHPDKSDEYHLIACRGVDISDSVSTEVELTAIQVVADAYETRTNPPPIKTA